MAESDEDAESEELDDVDSEGDGVSDGDVDDEATIAAIGGTHGIWATS